MTTIEPRHYPTLNRLAADRVLGWTVNRDHSPPAWNVPPEQTVFFKAFDLAPSEHAPAFCSSIFYAAALTEAVMKRLAASGTDPDSPSGPHLYIYQDGGQYVSPPWRVVIEHRQPWVAVNAPTEPLARTLACLRAVGVDIEKELA